MARKSTEPPQGGEARGEQVRLDAQMLRRARVIAAALGLSLPEYIQSRLAPIIERELPTVLEELGLKDT